MVSTRSATRRGTGVPETINPPFVAIEKALTPPRKKPRKAHQESTQPTFNVTQTPQLNDKGKGKASIVGKLAILNSNSLPFDILIEILSRLTPGDLVSLSYANKEFRTLLFKPSNLFIWRESLAQVPDLPPCPKDLTPIQYSTLLFGRYCNQCGTLPMVPRVEFAIRIRLCVSCRKACLVRKLEPEIRGYGLQELLFQTDVSSLIPNSGGEYYLPQVDELCEEFERTKRKEWAAYCKTRKAYMAAVNEHARACRVWMDKFTAVHQQEVENIKERRYQMIVEYLTEDGWGDDIALCGDALRNQSFVKKPKELTYHSWARMRRQVTDFLEEKRQERQEKERKQILTRLYHTFLENLGPSMEIWPSPDQLAEFEAFSAIIEKSDTVDEGIFAEAMSTLPKAVESWRNHLRCDLAYMQPPGCLRDRGDTPPEGVLRLATSVYRTKREGTLFYPGLLLHRSLVEKTLLQTSLEPFQLGPSTRTSAKPRDYIDWDPTGTSVVDAILEICSLNRDTTTPEDLDNLDARFLCLLCRNKQYALTWRRAIQHAHDTDWHVSEWRRLNPTEESHIKAREKERTEARNKKDPLWLFKKDVWSCNHCRARAECYCLFTATGPDGVRAHLRNAHEIQAPEHGVDYLWDTINITKKDRDLCNHAAEEFKPEEVPQEQEE
ncbi:hypothetical protein BOTBODRAFT_171834 [Botryobasidium botryosum FD-172 SS1]|uniref:F-box domain-containing protein n=1 Tax=Botryobasidium botryosum (strain FD-172 SS1) TaxID=930990 RepID=A0A067MQZ7_BOTB1|nr:hypothetical protein BOTBODRAFT_171834 [Botryobasidium botryosum FD-172 SS1]